MNFPKSYTYFIRPLTDNNSFNGVLLLILERVLTETEFNDLILAFTVILTEVAFNKVEILTQESVRGETFRQMWHNINFHLSGIMNVTNKLEKKYVEISKNESRTLDSVFLIPEFEKPSSWLHDFRETLELSRFVLNPRDYFFDRSNTKPRFIPRSISLPSIINKVLSMLDYDIREDNCRQLRVDTDRCKILREHLDKDLFNFVYDQKTDFNIISYRQVIEIIIKDILINATFRAYSVERNNPPKVTISLELDSIDSDIIKFTIRNECPIERKDFEKWMVTDIGINTQRQHSLGILICRTYLQFLNFPFSIDPISIKRRWRERDNTQYSV